MEIRVGILALLIGLIVAVVLIESSHAVGPRHYIEHNRVGCLLHCPLRGIVGDDASCAIVIRELIRSELLLASVVAALQFLVCHIPPQAFGQPDSALAHPILGRCVDGCHQYVVAKEIFVLVGVGILLLRIVVVEWTVDAYARFVGFAGSGVEIGEHAIAQAHGLAQLVEVFVLPDAAFQFAIICGMCTEDGTEYSKLQPALQKFGVVVAALMSAQVVPPVGIADVARCAGKGYFVAQCGPCGIGVATEGNGVAVAAQPTPAMIDDGPVVGAVALHVLVIDMV